MFSPCESCNKGYPYRDGLWSLVQNTVLRKSRLCGLDVGPRVWVAAVGDQRGVAAGGHGALFIAALTRRFFANTNPLPSHGHPKMSNYHDFYIVSQKLFTVRKVSCPVYRRAR